MRRTSALTAVAVMASSLVGLGVSAAPTAAGLTPPVTMTADSLPTWQTNGIVWALAEADGVAFAGGTFSSVRPPGAASGTGEQPAVNFAALDSATGAPTSCHLSFTVGSGDATVRALAVSKDRKTLYAGGFFGAVNGVQVSSLAAIDIATCTPVASFHPGYSGTVRAIGLSDDTVYTGGDFVTVDGQPRRHFGAVSTAGTLRPWTADTDEIGKAVEVTPDGQHVLLGGDFFTVGGADSHALAVVDAGTGALTTAYPLGFIPQTSTVQDITTDATGFYTANEGTGGGVFDGRIAIDYSTWKQRWRDTCLGATQGLAVYQGVLYSGSHAHDCSSMGEFPNQERKHLLAESVNDPKLLGWFPDTNDGIGEMVGPRVLTTSSAGGTDYLWVGGGFTTAEKKPQQGLMRMAAAPDTGTPSIPVADASSFRPGQARVSWQSSLDGDDSLLTYAVYRNGSSTPIHTTTGSSLPWVRPQLSFTDTTVAAGTTYTYRVTASDAAGNTSALSAAATVAVPTVSQGYPAQVLDDGASLYWRFDETSGTTAADSSGAADDGVYVGTPAYGQTPAAVTGTGTAVGLNGSDAYVRSERIHNTPAEYSVETWFRTTTTNGGKLIGFGNQPTGASSNYDKHVYMTNDGRLVFGVWTGSARTLQTSVPYNDGLWHHVVGTQGPAGMRLYVDGAEAGSNAVTTSQVYDGYWRVGGDNLNGWPNQPSSSYLNGQVDETAVYPSALSAEQVAQLHTLASQPVPPADTVVTLSASADSYVNGAATGTNYGGDKQIAARGSSPYLSYLRFPLPAAPAGQVLKNAVLRVRTSSDANAGSGDTFPVTVVPGGWTETGVTYANRPAPSSTVLGTLTGVTQIQTPYTAALDAASLSGSLGGDLDVALSGSGTDSLWLWSREVGTADWRPQLVLTFGAP